MFTKYESKSFCICFDKCNSFGQYFVVQKIPILHPQRVIVNSKGEGSGKRSVAKLEFLEEVGGGGDRYGYFLEPHIQNCLKIGVLC